MTALELYNASLTEGNKVNAPSFTVDAFNYFVNKTLSNVANTKYAMYATNQQLSDDLRVLLMPYEIVGIPELVGTLTELVKSDEEDKFYSGFKMEPILPVVGEVVTFANIPSEYTVISVVDDVAYFEPPMRILKKYIYDPTGGGGGAME